MSECQCRECSTRRETAQKMEQWREEMYRANVGFGEFDWEDLEKSCREYRQWVMERRKNEK